MKRKTDSTRVKRVKQNTPTPMPDSPYKLTPDRIEAVCKSLRLGNRLDTSAAACGVARSTFFEWLRKGRRDRDAQVQSEEAAFVERVDEAQAQAEQRAVARVRRAGREDWRAEAFWLERRHPESWGQKDTHVVETRVKSELAGMLDKLQGAMAPEEYDRVLRIIAGDAGAGAADDEARDEGS